VTAVVVDYTVLRTMSSGPLLPSTLVRAVEQLAPMPVTAQRLVALMQGEDESLTRIAELVEFDQVIAASVLRMARSWTYAGSRPPETVRDAVVQIGTVPLLNMLLGEYMSGLRTAAPLYDLTEDDLWCHAAASQLAVRALMHECPSANLPPVAATAALLHDIGKLVMSRCLNASVETIVGYAKQHNVTFVEAEQQLFGVNHAAVGAAIAVAIPGRRHRRDRPASRPASGSVHSGPRRRGHRQHGGQEHRHGTRCRRLQSQRRQRVRTPPRPRLHALRARVSANR
jgi:hypothetical protein